MDPWATSSVIGGVVHLLASADGVAPAAIDRGQGRLGIAGAEDPSGLATLLKFLTCQNNWMRFLVRVVFVISETVIDIGISPIQAPQLIIGTGWSWGPLIRRPVISAHHQTVGTAKAT
jgi:hypothetical protein